MGNLAALTLIIVTIVVVGLIVIGTMKRNADTIFVIPDWFGQRMLGPGGERRYLPPAAPNLGPGGERRYFPVVPNLGPGGTQHMLGPGGTHSPALLGKGGKEGFEAFAAF